MTCRRHRIDTRTVVLTLLAVTAVGSATACGNVTPGGVGEATVAVSGDAGAPIPGVSFAALPAAVGPLASAETDEAEGELELRFDLYLLDEAGGQRQIGDDGILVDVDLRGRDEPEVVSELVPAGLYPTLRVVFSQIEVEVEGLVIDDMPVPEVEVELEGTLPVEREVDLRIEDGGMVALLIDLNALAWLEAVDPVAGTVDDAVLGGFIDVVVR